jgi:hypothetical protein
MPPDPGDTRLHRVSPTPPALAPPGGELVRKKSQTGLIPAPLHASAAGLPPPIVSLDHGGLPPPLPGSAAAPVAVSKPPPPVAPYVPPAPKKADKKTEKLRKKGKGDPYKDDDAFF